jgi:RHS repeat-associated protein
VEAQSVTYAYDSAGLRSAAVTDYGNGVTDKTLYLRDPFGNLLMRRTKSGVTEAVTSFLPDLSGSLATHTDGGERYLLKDVLGSSCVEVSSSGAGNSQYRYGPFGELLAGPSGDEMPYRYTGQEQDQTLEIYNYNARLYDSALRRFYGCDPVDEYASPYLYTADDPINSTDPTGAYVEMVLRLALKGIRFPLSFAVRMGANYYAPIRDKYQAALGTGNDIISLKERDWVESGSSFTFLDRIMPYVLSRYKTQNIVEVERSNAMAHFTWQSHLTFIHGPEAARMLGDAHETGVIRPGPDTIADKINNAMGRHATILWTSLPDSWSMLEHLTTIALIYAKTTVDRIRDSYVKDPKSPLHRWVSVAPFIPRDTSDWLFETEWRAGHLAKATTDQNLFEKLNSAQIHERFTIPLLHLSRTYGVRPQDILNTGELDLLRTYTQWYSEWDDT